LLVEDEQAIRKYVHQVLVNHGYRVLVATNGREAVEKASEFREPILLLVTDVVMPIMGGSELSQHFESVRPGIPVLHMSGYTDRLWRDGTGIETSIEKPFTADALLTAIRTLLARSATKTA
jgi:DNA-binding NtrC family response regulator